MTDDSNVHNCEAIGKLLKLKGRIVDAIAEHRKQIEALENKTRGVAAAMKAIAHDRR